MTVSPAGQAALGYASRGWAVLPCHHITGSGCSCHHADCSSPGKHPRTRTGLHEATTDTDRIGAWWRRWPHANVGINTGRASGLVVLDVDPDHGGITTLRKLVAERGRLPSGLRARTGSGGWHLYFAHPGGTVPNSAGRLGPGLDIRGDGGYVIAPPSNHRAGGTYSFIGAAAPIPAMPGWLHDQVRPPSTPRTANDPIHVGEAIDAWVRAAILDEAARVRHAPEGRRNATLNRAAFSLGQIVATGIIDADTVRLVLSDSAFTVGLGQREIDATIRSGLTAGLQQPRGPSRRGTPGAELSLP